jgi:hypothetical protein
MADQKKQAALKPETRAECWMIYNGLDCEAALCYCCNKEICTLRNWVAAHVIARELGGDDSVDNLRPCCSWCNTSMGTEDMRVWAASKGFTGRITREVGAPILPEMKVVCTVTPTLPPPVGFPPAVQGLLEERNLLLRKLTEIDAQLAARGFPQNPPK